MSGRGQHPGNRLTRGHAGSNPTPCGIADRHLRHKPEVPFLRVRTEQSPSFHVIAEMRRPPCRITAGIHGVRRNRRAGIKERADSLPRTRPGSGKRGTRKTRNKAALARKRQKRQYRGKLCQVLANTVERWYNNSEYTPEDTGMRKRRGARFCTAGAPPLTGRTGEIRCGQNRESGRRDVRLQRRTDAFVR